MPTRAEILDTLAESQTQVMAFFQGLSPAALERPATVSGIPGAAPWRAKDHGAHLINSERAMQQLLHHTLAGEARDVLLPKSPSCRRLFGASGCKGFLVKSDE